MIKYMNSIKKNNKKKLNNIINKNFKLNKT